MARVHYLILTAVLHGKILSPILQMEKQRPKEIKSVAQGHTAKKEAIQDLTQLGPSVLNLIQQLPRVPGRKGLVLVVGFQGP